MNMNAKPSGTKCSGVSVTIQCWRYTFYYAFTSFSYCQQQDNGAYTEWMQSVHCPVKTAGPLIGRTIMLLPWSPIIHNIKARAQFPGRTVTLRWVTYWNVQICIEIRKLLNLCYGYYSLTHRQHRTQCLLYMYNWCIIANTHLKVTIRMSHSSYCWSIAKYMSGYSLSILCFLRLCKWNFHFLIFFCCCCLGPCTRILLPFSKARIFLVSTNRSALSARCKPLAEAGGERPNGVTRAMSQLAFGSVRRRRPTLALDLGRVADDHDGACGMVDKVIGHAAKNRALHFAETACSRDDHHRCYLIGNLADNFAGLSRCCTQCSRNLHNIQFRRNTR